MASDAAGGELLDEGASSKGLQSLGRAHGRSHSRMDEEVTGDTRIFRS